MCTTPKIHATLLTQLPALRPVPRAAVPAGVGALRAAVEVAAAANAVVGVAAAANAAVGVAAAANAGVAAAVVDAGDVPAPDLALDPVLATAAPDETLPGTPSSQMRTRPTARKSTLVTLIIGLVQRATYYPGTQSFLKLQTLYIYFHSYVSVVAVVRSVSHCHVCSKHLC